VIVSIRNGPLVMSACSISCNDGHWPSGTRICETSAP
jgi:hypothetical protein